MRNTNEPFWALNRSGEIVYKGLNEDVRKKFAPDSPFFHSIVPYIMLLVCAAIDFFVFKSKFDLISYGGDVMRAFSIAGLLVGFDVVPIFTGIHLRRLEQGLSRAGYILGIMLTVTALAVGLNVSICVSTMDDMRPQTKENSSMFDATEPDTESESEKTNPNAAVVSMTMFNCILPLVTSGASFCVSYVTYDPLSIRKRREEEVIREKRDQIRRLDAVILDYECDMDFAVRLEQLDENMYQECLKRQRAQVLKYCDYVRQRLKEHLLDPASITALSAESCDTILKKLDRELKALDNMDDPCIIQDLDEHHTLTAKAA